MGRPPIGKTAMTAAERQRRRRERLAATVPAPERRPRVLNVKDDWPVADCVYVGRMRRYGDPRWGNPFKIGRDGSRDEVIARYRAWIETQPALMAALPKLRGKDLACHCAPERCHAEVLIELANAYAPERLNQ